MLRAVEHNQIESPARVANMIVAALSKDDAAALLQHVGRVMLKSGEQALLGGNDRVLWLPETAILSFGETMGDRHVECGMVGREGAIGWGPLAGLQPVSQRITALIGGTVHGLAHDRLTMLCAHRPAIAALMLRFREALMAQMGSTIAARLQCSPDRRLARWLCMLHDRVEGDTLDITHLRLAAFLNARRASVTDCLHVLEGERIVRCTRGKIFVRNRAALAEAAGPGYGTAEAAYRALVGPLGKTGSLQTP